MVLYGVREEGRVNTVKLKKRKLFIFEYLVFSMVCTVSFCNNKVYKYNLIPIITLKGGVKRI